MIGLVRHTPVLRRRALYQGMMFAAFNVFWTGAPLLLIQGYGMSLHGVAMSAVCLAFLLAAWAVEHRSVLVLAIAGLVLDAAVQICQVVSLRSIYMLAPELRS